MIITSHFRDQAHRGSVPQAMIDALEKANYPPDSAVVLGIVPETKAIAIAIIRRARNDKKRVVATTCIARFRTWRNPQVLGVERVYELKK